ncbi:MAG: EF-P lysine aminoacylase GenX [Kiritimatiellae bacterium]|nr:EF-P lysine aminoacylase GenX [Kiritimatiellia bacterium]
MRIDLVKPRAEIVRGIRRFFDAAGFTETTTPVWIAAPAPEPHIDCPPCGAGYLRASPELQMKKLLAAGLDKIYQIGPCFRDGERGSRHNPEFTMIEWYRLHADYRAIADDLRALLASLATGELADEVAACRTIAVRDAYARWAGWDPWTAWDQDRFDYDMAAKIEPNLPPTPTFLTDYPPAAASLSKLRGDVAERWEFYWRGMELANCFTELCDPAEQRRRFELAREERRRIGEADYPLDDGFLDALNAIESAAGVALGVDRLVMALTGAERIEEVL